RTRPHSRLIGGSVSRVDDRAPGASHRRRPTAWAGRQGCRRVSVSRCPCSARAAPSRISAPRMETIPSSQWRSEIRASIQYLRAIRPLVEGMASEHAAWARFVGNIVSPQGTILPREQVLGATRFALTFARLQARLKRVRPTVSGTTLHEAALAWAEAL